MERIRHAIFDLDGTLVDSLPGIEWSIQAALARCGLPPLSRDLRPLIGPPIRRILAAVSGVREPERLDRLEYAFRSSYDSGGWRRTRLQAGAAELLEQLRDGGIGLWVVTNKPARATRRILEGLQLAGLFEEIRCRDSRTPAFGSKAEVLVDLLRRRALTPSACLMIGDTAEDSEAAMAAGIDCAIVADGYGVDTPLPAGSKRVSGWDEIAELCAVALCAGERC
jgi:phosphoglycolate phosphatase